jgi:deazaflavin-dependent oxidoreductase (nitroreductase family)
MCHRRDDGWVDADDYCYLTTTGRRSGRAHRIEIWYAAEGGSLYLLSGGGRSSDWVQNVLADASVTVELDGVEWTARARVLDNGGEEEKRARSLVYAKYAPRSQSDLTGWRERALPVALDLEVE